MWFTLPKETPLYRVSRAEDNWDDVLQGYGAFYTSGGRYHGPRQQTVYATEDPRVALTEWGWHAGLDFWGELGDGKSLRYPLARTAKLWRFALSTDVTLIDVTDAMSAQQFGYPRHAPFNPHADRYSATQRIANQVSGVTAPSAQRTRPEGVLARSVRTPALGNDLPLQTALFVLPKPVVQLTLAERATLLAQWDVELEFTTGPDALPVTPIEPHVAWSAPRVRLTGGKPVPKYKGRSQGPSFRLNQWHTLDVRYTTY